MYSTNLDYSQPGLFGVADTRVAPRRGFSLRASLDSSPSSDSKVNPGLRRTVRSEIVHNEMTEMVLNEPEEVITRKNNDIQPHLRALTASDSIPAGLLCTRRGCSEITVSLSFGCTD